MPVSTIHSNGQPADIRTGKGGSDATLGQRQSITGDSSRADRGSAPETGASTKVPSLEERRQQAFQTIEQTLAMGYEMLTERWLSPRVCAL